MDDTNYITACANYCNIYPTTNTYRFPCAKMMAAPPNVYDNENVFSAFLSRSLLLLLFVGGILLYLANTVHFYKKSSNVFPLIFPIKSMRIARAFNPTMKQRSNLYDGEYFEIIDNTGNGKSVIVQCNLCKVENNPKLHIRKCLTSNGNVFKHVEVSGLRLYGRGYLWFTPVRFFSESSSGNVEQNQNGKERAFARRSASQKRAETEENQKSMLAHQYTSQVVGCAEQ